MLAVTFALSVSLAEGFQRVASKVFSLAAKRCPVSQRSWQSPASQAAVMLGAPLANVAAGPAPVRGCRCCRKVKHWFKTLVLMTFGVVLEQAPVPGRWAGSRQIGSSCAVVSLQKSGGRRCCEFLWCEGVTVFEGCPRMEVPQARQPISVFL